MQFYNKRHKVRERCWFEVPLTDQHQRTRSREQTKKELWDYDSTGRFYIDWQPAVWFEKKEDAVWFTLKWA